MKRVSNFLFIILSVIVTASSVQAGMMDGFQAPTSLEWQIVKLQENIEKKITKSLNPIIKEDEYIIEVKIGVDKDAVDEPSNKMIKKTKQNSKVKFTAAEVQKNGEEYIVFSKLGLEAPLFGDEAVETQTSEAELNQKAIIELNDRYNLFKYLKTIDINLTFDSGLTPKAKEVIKKVVQGLSFNINEVIPQINTQFLDLKANKIKSLNDPMAQGVAGAGGAGNSKMQGSLKQDNNLAPRFYEFFKNLDVMLGLIIAALIIAATLIILAKTAKKVDEDEKANENPVPMNVQKSQETEESHDEDGEEDMKFDLTKTDAVTMAINEGIERFRKALSNHHDDAILLIKGMVKNKNDEDVRALSSIVMMFTDAELAEIFNTLTNDERMTWKSILQSQLNKEEVGAGFTYLSTKITEMMLVPTLINDYETCDLLLEVTPQDAAKFSIDNMDLGVLFTNVLSSNIISEMFKIIPSELVVELIDRSADFKADSVAKTLPLLKKKLEEVKAKRERPPFLKRIFEILPSASAEVEQKLYGTLMKHFPLDEVKVTALKIYPKALVADMPDEVFKQVVGTMPIDTQVQYFASLQSEDRDFMLDKFAVKGSKARDMVEVEMATILKNEVALRRLQVEKKEKLYQEFINYSRQLISSNVEIQGEVIDQIESWLHNINDESIAEPTDESVAA